MCGRMVGELFTHALENLMAKSPTLTTDNGGAPVVDNQNSLTAGPRAAADAGRAADREARPPEPRAHSRAPVHAKGSGAYGTLHRHPRHHAYTTARLFSTVGKKTEMFARFSTVAGERGAADAERDMRGFALKFYTEEGNWDLVGNNTPVFFVRDPLKFPDFIQTAKRDPEDQHAHRHHNVGLLVAVARSLHQVTILMCDRGMPDAIATCTASARTPTASSTRRGERFWVKFHFKTQQGIKNLTNAEAAEIVGATARAISATCSTRSSAATSRVDVVRAGDARGRCARTGTTRST